MRPAYRVAAALAAIAIIFTVSTAAPSRAVVDPKPKSKEAVAKKGRDYVKQADRRRDKRNMYTFESVAYKITTDVDKDLANDIAGHMDAVAREYDGRFRGFQPNPHAAVKPGERMPLYVLRQYKDYVTFLKDFGVDGNNTGGVFFRTADKRSGLATWAEGQSQLRMYDVLQHEGFHQFADARIMFGLPPWVNEGLAEYFGEALLVDNKLLIGRPDRGRLERVRRAVKEGKVLPFVELMKMDNAEWVRRVNGGDKAASLMYDSVWSVCYFLIHGKEGRPLRARIRGKVVDALEAYLLILNDEFVRSPRKDPRPLAFKEVFSNNHKAFEAAWKDGLAKLEPDPWFSSVRHAQFIGAGLKLLHEKEVDVQDWADAKEKLERFKFRMVPRERDAAAQGQRKPQVEEIATGYDFPAPAEVELVPSDDPKLPPGLLVTKVTPNIALSWKANADGGVEEDIRFIDPPRQQPKKGAAVVADVPSPSPRRSK